MKKIRFIELFAGIGGFRYGLERCMGVERTDEESEQTEPEVQFGGVGTSMEVRPGVLPTNFRGERSIYSCVWANEIDKYACQIYRKNFGEGELYEGDITKVSSGDIPEHDLLVGGFPCQAFSIAGKRGGFDDTRGTLFFEIARILRHKRPRCVLLENVKGLLSHDSGKTFQTILKVLTDIGYRVEWQVLNSKNFGVPQNRERVFIVGHLRGESSGQVFPIRRTNSKDIIVSGVLDTETWRKRHEQIRRIHHPEGISPTIPTGTGGGVMTKVDLRPRVRRLTPTECERLQGFPDGWTEEGLTPNGDYVTISDTQRYKTLGNAVSTPVITEIGRRL